MSEKQLLYVNMATVAFSTNDFEFGLGVKKDRVPNVPPSPDDIDIDVLMSPQHTKSFLLALTQAVKIYEEMYGEINVNQNPEVLKKYSSLSSSNQ
jgi:hypothetical protein